MEEIGDLGEVGCRGEEMGNELEVLVGEADIHAETSPATSEGNREEGVPHHSTLAEGRTLMGAISRRAQAKATHGPGVSKEHGVQTLGPRDSTRHRPETPFLPFAPTRTAKSVARMTMIPQTALS